jgi:hypothetical protein
MVYFTHQQTRELKTVKFDQAFQIYTEAADLAWKTQLAIRDQEFEEEVQRLEQAWSDTHEAPSEVSFADRVDLPKLDKVAIERAAGQKALVEEFIPKYNLETILQLYLMPQIIRYISRDFSDQWLREVSTAEGKIDGNRAVNRIFNGFGSDWDKGLYLFLMLDSRATWLKSQYKGEARNYCSLVPLIPYAFKVLHSIPYSQWDKATIHRVVNKSLSDAMLSSKPEATREELLELRELSLLVKTGPKAGTSRKPETTYKLYNLKNTILQNTPELAKAMALQTWCAHPVNRTKFMVLDPENWDYIPAPLVTTQLFKVQPTSRALETADPSQDLPWNV